MGGRSVGFEFQGFGRDEQLMFGRRARLWVSLAVLVPAWGVASATEPKETPPPSADAELLEFLGSVDSAGDSQAAADDGSWMDYLSRTDINKVAKANTPPGAPKQVLTPNPPPASGDKKDD